MTDGAGIQARMAEIQACLGAMEAAWPAVAAELQRRRAEKVEQLVVSENPELRGKIKQIDEFMQMPQDLRREIHDLSNALPK